MKSVALKRSDRLQTQILVVTWVTICTVFALIPLFITLINAFKGHSEMEYAGCEYIQQLQRGVGSDERTFCTQFARHHFGGVY